MRRGGLSVSVRPYVCRQKTRLFAVLPHRKSARNSSLPLGLAFIFFERCLETRTSLLSSAKAMAFLIALRPRGWLEHYG